MSRKSYLLLAALGALANAVGTTAWADQLNPQPLPPHEDCVRCVRQLVISPVTSTHAPRTMRRIVLRTRAGR
jgi:hypothetical protein